MRWVPVVLLATLVGGGGALSGCSGERPEAAPVAATAAPAAIARSQRAPVPVRPEVTTAAPKPHRIRIAAEAPRSGTAGLDRFVAAVQRQLPEVALDRRDEEIEAIGQEACADLAAGKKSAAAARHLAGEGVTADQAGKLVTLARSLVCET